MQLIDFVDACDMSSKTELEIFELLCYYQMREAGTVSFSVKKMLAVYGEAGLPAPERKAMEKQAKKSPRFRPHGIEGTLRFASGVVGSLDKAYGHLWSGGAVHSASASASAASSMPVDVSLPDFAAACNMSSRTGAEQFELLCYYRMRENGIKLFAARDMTDIYTGAGLTAPERSVLKKDIKGHASFVPRGIDGSVEFTPSAVRTLDGLYGRMWDGGTQAQPADRASPKAASGGAEVLSEERFCGKREGLDRLIVQINSSYRDGSFDACASVMRRLLESVLILSFQANGIESEIRGTGGDYLGFGDIIKKAAASSVLGLPQKGIDISAVSRVGDYAGKGPMYTFGANDINAVRTGYRNVLETLYESAKLT
ncbi:MAG: hypothetical protein LBH69_05210 [Methanomassiliicoccaceae archaeon]|jgi:hypothetical protein|nr:hypothetical protein [Methanomassiliicoccaceae archaeon]